MANVENKSLSLEEATAFVKDKVEKTAGKAKAGWTYVSNNLTETYKNEKAIALKDGKIDISDVISLAERGGEAAKKEAVDAFNNLKDAGELAINEYGLKSGFDKNKGSIMGALLMGALAFFGMEMGIGGMLIMALLGAAIGGGLFDKDGLVGGFVQNMFHHGEEPSKSAEQGKGLEKTLENPFGKQENKPTKILGVENPFTNQKALDDLVNRKNLVPDYLLNQAVTPDKDSVLMPLNSPVAHNPAGKSK